MSAPSAYLIARTDSGFGTVYPLQRGVHYTLGRAPGNRIVLNDELCSREHAELYSVEGQWYAPTSAVSTVPSSTPSPSGLMNRSRQGTN